MQIGKKIGEELSFISTVETLVKAYEEISVVKMQRVRSTVLSTREFLDLLHEVFSDVKTSYANEIIKIEKKKKESRKTTQKNAGIFLSANSGLYGDIVKRVFRTYIEDHNKNYEQIIIVGKIGRELLENHDKTLEYEYFDYDDSNISKDLIPSILEKLKDFDSVLVYYGKFENVVTQSPMVTNVLGDAPEVVEQDKKVSFFFEPTLGQILSYFESQVISAFLLQSIHESDLAKLASRTKAMEQAHQRIEDRQTALSLASKRAKNLMEDRRQQERISGIYLWKR